MAPEREDISPRGCLPQLDRSVRTGASYEPATGTEQRRRHLVCMADQGLDFATGLDAPDPDSPVVAARSHPLPVRAKGCRPDLIGVANKFQQRIGAGNVP